MKVGHLIACLFAIALIGKGMPALAQDMGPLQHPLANATVSRAEVVAGKRADGSDLVVTLSTQATESDAKRPVVVLLHGGVPAGVPRPSTWPIYETWGNALAASGIGAVMFDHNLGFPKRDLDRALGELDTVLAWLRDKGAEYGLDAGRVTVFSFSAGGLFTPSLGDPARPLQVGRVATFYPLTGIVPGSPSAAETDPALIDRMALSVAAQSFGARKLPLLIVRAGADGVPGLRDLLDSAIAALLAADAPIELINIPGAPHSFDFRVDSDAVRQAIDRAIRFATGG